MDQPPNTPPDQARLIGDLRQVIENAEELLKNTGQFTSEDYARARSKLAEALTHATDELVRIEDAHLLRMIAATEDACRRHAEPSGEARIMRAFSDE
ncbi:DUF883 family protein [Massilia sp. TS11]|uniref:DUF883 family protein n=1 Tax=Massilia sp. TS11 TaxID=2908003 RepID=UPI001EDAC497|nr:DUF883 family protein [Massilia sp. TS11]MCG2585645.1 DUF883 family protein [Massilia sp. TS11]